MNKSRLKLDHILNLREGIEEDYSIPETVTYLSAPSNASRREANERSEDCAILQI